MLKSIINSIVRLAPVSLYMGSIVAGLVFEQTRAIFMFIGFVVTEMVCFIFLQIYKTIENPQCALLKSVDSVFILPAPIPLSYGYFCGFQIADMFSNEFNPIKIFFMIVFLFVVIWSRINVGCHSLLESCFAAVIGLGLGLGYYSVIKPFYNDSSINFFKKKENEEISDYSND
jgi:hypothetical protein